MFFKVSEAVIPSNAYFDAHRPRELSWGKFCPTAAKKGVMTLWVPSGGVEQGFGRTIYPHKLSPVSGRSSAAQGKFAGQSFTAFILAIRDT